jgi:type II secretory pathway component PulK
MTTLHRTQPRKAVVLLAVLVVVVLLSLAAYQYSELMSAEYRAASSHARALQARAAADSGVWYATALLGNPDNLDSISGNLWDNPTTFQDSSVSDSGVNGSNADNADQRKQMLFSLISVRDADDPAASSQPYRYGVVDESGKINLNALLQIDPSGNNVTQMLLQLPNMTPDIVNSILDWMDADDNTRQDGAENDYYSSQSPPYQCKNGPFDSLEELLLVKGVTPQLLFGNDRNRNGVLDPGEDDGTGQVDRGWLPYLTVYSRESNVDSQGNPRIYLNESDLNDLSSKLTTLLGQDLANFIVAYRLYGGTQSTSNFGGTPKMSASDSSAVSSQIRSARSSGQNKKLQKISSLYDLVNATVSVPVGSGRNQRTVSYPSPLRNASQQQQLLPLLLDGTTITSNAELPPRINVNTASQVVLTALPGLTENDVQAILSNRPQVSDNSAPDPSYQTPAWLITKANFSISKMKTLEKYITARTQVYRVQSLGYSAAGGPVSRVEAVIDSNLGRPRILAWRDLSELGKGFDVFQANSKNP